MKSTIFKIPVGTFVRPVYRTYSKDLTRPDGIEVKIRIDATPKLHKLTLFLSREIDDQNCALEYMRQTVREWVVPPWYVGEISSPLWYDPYTIVFLSEHKLEPAMGFLVRTEKVMHR